MDDWVRLLILGVLLGYTITLTVRVWTLPPPALPGGVTWYGKQCQPAF